jgi:NADPH-dependent 2,4-dienoyl-CoA reductase/sulfur reductase-like enzyme
LAGFTAAMRARDQGAKVTLIDKSAGALGDGNVLVADDRLAREVAKELHYKVQ